MSMKGRAPLPSILFKLLALIFMALLAFIPEPSKTVQHTKRKRKQQQPSSWDQIKNLLTCKQIERFNIHEPSKPVPAGNVSTASTTKLTSSCRSMCSLSNVVHGNTKVVHRADNLPENSSVGKETRFPSRKAALVNGSASNRSLSSSARSNGDGGGATHTTSVSRGMQLRKLSGCYECHVIVDPCRYPSPRTRVCVCSECGEIFPKIESLELHQAVRHAVSELGPEDSGRNIVEIIFKSSWLNKDNPICKIERILKVVNPQRIIQRFEDCRDSVKIRAISTTKKNPRCAADGNELLRFHCTTLYCSLGKHDSSSLCAAVPRCGVCTIIRHGFQGKASLYGNGVRTTASSGRAHVCLGSCDAERRAMIVCRVVAGRVRRIVADGTQREDDDVQNTASPPGLLYDSVAAHSNLEDLVVFNPRAILPCFVVIYKAVKS